MRGRKESNETIENLENVYDFRAFQIKKMKGAMPYQEKPLDEKDELIKILYDKIELYKKEIEIMDSIIEEQKKAIEYCNEIEELRQQEIEYYKKLVDVMKKEKKKMSKNG